MLNFGGGEAEYLRKKDWTGRIALIWKENSAFAAQATGGGSTQNSGKPNSDYLAPSFRGAPKGPRNARPDGANPESISPQTAWINGFRTAAPRLPE